MEATAPTGRPGGRLRSSGQVTPRRPDPPARAACSAGPSTTSSPARRGSGRWCAARCAASSPSAPPGWDERTGAGGVEHLAPLAAAVLDVSPSPERVLDVGCGTGEGTLFLAREFPQARVRGVDISEEMIAAGRRQGRPRPGGPDRLQGRRRRRSALSRTSPSTSSPSSTCRRSSTRSRASCGRAATSSSRRAGATRTPFYTPAEAAQLEVPPARHRAGRERRGRLGDLLRRPPRAATPPPRRLGSCRSMEIEGPRRWRCSSTRPRAAAGRGSCCRQVEEALDERRMAFRVERTHEPRARGRRGPSRRRGAERSRS